jgi:MoxR-like ATPase
MSSLYYMGDGTRHPSELPIKSHLRPRRRPQDYIAEPGLVNAVNVALLLDKPLLLTGESGTGKTQLAYSLAWELQLGDPLKYETKSTSNARDLFYTIDSIGRFKSNKEDDVLAFLTYNALGSAILYANDEAAVTKYLKPDTIHRGKRRSVVLIDEVDKAPRDFPNDILNEIEYRRFSIPEMDSNEISADDPDYQPIVVITSNSEKDLPDAFLRRCIFYDIPFPKHDTLQKIVVARLGESSASSSPFLASALELLFTLRDQTSQLRKKPATGELLDWLLALRPYQQGDEQKLTLDIVQKTLSSLIKTAEDQEQAEKVVHRWYSR